MPHTINADGSATYSITIPAPLEVTLAADGSTWASGGATYVASPDLPSDTAWLQALAGQIAITDERQARAAATKLAARDALATALYNADVAGSTPAADPWSVLTDDARAPYRAKADTLGGLGVSAVVA